MHCGSGWVVIEEQRSDGASKLVSVISPRRSSDFVARYIEQLYVDRYASMPERLEYKKSRKHSAYRAQIERCQRIMHCGDDPVFHAVYSHGISLTEKRLDFMYKILVTSDASQDPVFEPRNQYVAIDA